MFNHQSLKNNNGVVAMRVVLCETNVTNNFIKIKKATYGNIRLAEMFTHFIFILFQWIWGRFDLHKIMLLKWQRISVTTNKMLHFSVEHPTGGDRNWWGSQNGARNKPYATYGSKINGSTVLGSVER